MLKWIPLMLAATLVLFSGCKKSETPKTEPMADTSAVLPEPPELEPIDDAFPTVEGEPAMAPENSSEKSKASKPAAKPAAKTGEKASNGAKASKAGPSASAAAGPSKGGAYTLQVGIYNTEKLAQKRAEALKTQGFEAYVVRVENPKPEMMGTYYRVRVGSFATATEARAYGDENLKPAGVAFWADLKSHDSKALKAAQPAQTFKAEYQVKNAPAAAPVVAPSTPAAPAATPETPAATESTDDSQPAAKLPDW